MIHCGDAGPEELMLDTQIMAIMGVGRSLLAVLIRPAGWQ